MADRENQAYQTTQQQQPNFYSPQTAGQSKPPLPAPNGPFPSGGVFQSSSTGGGQGSALGQHMGAHPPPANVNGFPIQQARMPLGPTGFPPISTAQVGQTSNLRPQGASGQFPPPPSSAQPVGALLNGPGHMDSRPPVPAGFVSPSKPAQVPGVPPSGHQGSSPGYGNVPQSGYPAPPPVRPLPPTSNVAQPPPSAPFGAGKEGTAGDSNPSRPNELPVPFHGQGQYSHQVNPFMQKTPTQTPSNSEPPSERSSRGPSPVSGSTVDALEGQFSPVHGAPSPAFPGARYSPDSSHTPGMPHKAVGTFTPPSQGQLPSQTFGQQSQRPPAFSSPNQQLPSHTGFPPGPPRPPPLSAQQQPAGQHGQFQPQQLALQRPPPPAGFPPSAGQPPGGSALTGTRPRYPPPAGNSGAFPPQIPAPGSSTGFPPPSSNVAANFTSPTASSNVTGGFPPQMNPPGFTPFSSAGASMLPPPAHSKPSGPQFPASSMASGFAPPPPISSTATGIPPPPLNAPGFSQLQAPAGSVHPPPMTGSGPRPVASPMMGSRPEASLTSTYGSLPPAGPSPVTPGHYPSPQYGQPGAPQSMMGAYPNSTNAVTQNLAHMGIQDTQRVVNLLNERNLLPPDGIESIKPSLPQELKKVNCSPDIFRCTLTAVPQNSALLNKARLPLGILIHPFRDLSQLPVIQSSVIVRCRSCRTYINPYVVFLDQRKWKCNLCFRVNDLPDEFSFDPVSKTYGDPQRRPEVKSATIEFIAPSEYMLRPPQPAVYLFLLDVSFNAVETGYLSQFTQILLDELDKLPGDARTSIGFICYDSTLYYFNLAEGLSQPQMLCVPDLEDPFLPCPDNLLVNLHESRELVVDLLNQLPNLFQGNMETGSALGAALQAAHKLMSPTGGRITVMQTCLPTVGAGALQNREAGNISEKSASAIGPATDFYKKLSLDCSAQQIAVDLFMLNGQYSDIATLSCISKYSAGCIYYYPSFHTVKNPGLVDKFDTDLRRYLTRKIGFESVMRIRCTRGLSIHTFHGNFFVRSTDLLSLPNINPDAGFGMQMSIEENLVESSTVSFQAALLYTSSKGERRIRVHTLCLPVTNQLSEVFMGADQQAISALLAKMAVDRSLNSALSDARDAMMNASLDALMAYGQQIPASQRVGTMLAPYSLRLLPMFMLAMLKHVAFTLAGNIKIDDRVFAMQQCKALPVCYLLQNLYPHLYPLHRLSDEKPIISGKEEIPSAPMLQLSSANIDRTGLFLMDTGEAMYLLVGSGIGDQMCQDVFDKPNFMSIPEGLMDLPELENPTSERIRSFVNYLMDSRPHGVTFLVVRDDGKHRHLFFQHMLEDRTENSMSYFEFLQFLQGKAKG